MTPDPDLNRDDPLAGYPDGDPDAVRAARPDEPTEAEWERVRRRIHARLNPAPARTGNPARWVAGAVALALTAAALAAWFAFEPVPVAQPEVVERGAPVAPPALQDEDPLSGLAVLPMAAPEDVDLRRVPGAGWLPVGADPLPAALALATEGEVEFDDPNPAWPQVTPSPGDAPMIFATKPR